MNSGQDPLTETDLNETLERFGVMDRARTPGVYALELATPADDANTVLRSWVDHYDANPPDGFAARAASAERLCYVGSHAQSVYQRLCQHVAGHKSSTIMEVWPPVDVVAIWPHDAPTAQEYNHAQELSDERTVCWLDGEYV